MAKLPKIVAIIGPTASGKTDLGSMLAQKYNGEIISADARQVYRGMDIGTAKERDLPIPQHLIDIKDPGEQMTVREYQQMAYHVIDDLVQKGKVPFLVGGSGMYAESVINGYVFTPGQKSKEQQPKYACLKLGIAIDREQLKEKAALRLVKRSKQGLLEEVQGLLRSGVSPEWLESCGLEYRYFSQFALGQISEQEALEKTRIATNQFIKRQYTWWRRHSDITWISSWEAAEHLVQEFLSRE